MVNRGEEKVWVQMNVVPRSTGNTNSGTRELTLKCKLKCYFKPMNNPLGVSPSKGKQGTTRGKEKNLLTSVGIEPTTYGLDLPSLCRLSYKVAQRKSGTILDGESRRRESMGTNACSLSKMALCCSIFHLYDLHDLKAGVNPNRSEI